MQEELLFVVIFGWRLSLTNELSRSFFLFVDLHKHGLLPFFLVRTVDVTDVFRGLEDHRTTGMDHATEEGIVHGVVYSKTRKSRASRCPPSGASYLKQ